MKKALITTLERFLKFLKRNEPNVEIFEIENLSLELLRKTRRIMLKSEKSVKKFRMNKGRYPVHLIFKLGDKRFFLGIKKLKEIK